jgi:hypothetical protein
MSMQRAAQAWAWARQGHEGPCRSWISKELLQLSTFGSVSLEFVTILPVLVSRINTRRSLHDK